MGRSSAIAPRIQSPRCAYALEVRGSSQSPRLPCLNVRWLCTPVLGQRFLDSPASHSRLCGQMKVSSLRWSSFAPAGAIRPCFKPEAASKLPAEPCDTDRRVLELWQAAGVEPQPPLLQLHTSSSGVRGLAVRSDASVNSGQLLLSVPMSNMLMVPKEVQGGQRNSSGADQARGALGDAAGRLAVKLLVELRRPFSLWQQYAHLLPTYYENVAEWTLQELAELQSDVVVEAAIATNDQWQQQGTLIQEDVTRQLGTPHIADPALKDSSSPSIAAPTTTISAPAVAHDPTSTDPSRIHSLEGCAPDNGASSSPSAPLWQLPLSHGAALWALRTVLTRSFSATFEGAPIQCLVPVVDLLNHAPPEKPFQANPSPVWPRSHSAPDLGFSQWRIHCPQGHPSSAACFQVFASAPVAAGQEATICYGPHTNVEFLVSFGFVPETNPADSVTLYQSIQDVIDDVDAPVKLERQKTELLCGLMGRTRHFAADADGTAPALLESLYVVHACDAVELAGLESAWQSSKSLTSAHISRARRAAAGRQVVQRCTELLSRQSTSLEEDQKKKEKLDADSRGISQRMRMALALRMARKQILIRTRRRYAALAELV